MREGEGEREKVKSQNQLGIVSSLFASVKNHE